MKMHVKLGIIFSSITLILTLTYTVFFYTYERDVFSTTAKENLTALGERMITQFDEYIQVMDYTLENLIANSEFMNAMAMHTYLPDRDQRMLEAKNTMGNVLYREPLNKNFYRVNAFNRRGMFYTSRFDNRDTVNSLTHDITQIVGGIQWLDIADEQRFKRMLVAPYLDPWTVGNDVSVFSAMRSIVWMGLHVGYLEVQAKEEELAGIFSPQGLEGVNVCAFINDGSLIYESEEGIAPRGMTYLSEEKDGTQEREALYELSLDSDKNSLAIYISQSTEALEASLFHIMYRLGFFAIILLIISLLIIFLVSSHLTRSIRQLEKKISGVHLSDRVLTPGISGLKKEDEIYRLESAFRALLERLNLSIQDEMRAQELQLSARMGALQAQINPHFIYNTLNVISSKSLEHNVLDIAEICDKFSEMLRYTINIENKTVTLKDELKHVLNYLELMKSRYEHRLHYSIDIPEDIQQSMLPMLSLQPLVENAIQHGYLHNARDMEINISGRMDSGKLSIEIRDNGDGFSKEVLQNMLVFSMQLRQSKYSMQKETAASGKGVGMMNTLSRLYYFSNGSMTFSLFNEDGAVIQINFAKQWGCDDV